MTAPHDPHRFASLVEAHKGILYKVANGYCRQRDDRADLIQEILIQAFRAFPRYDETQGRFSTWLYRIAMNVAISAHRSEARRIRDTVPLNTYGIDLAAADRTMDAASDDVRLLQRLVGELDPLSRALILLYLDGYTHDEIADVLGISSTNASTRVARLKDKLQRQLDTAQTGGTDDDR